MIDETIPGNIKFTGIAQNNPGDSDIPQETTRINPHINTEVAARKIAR